LSTTAQLRPVLTTQGERYTVAAIVVQESADGAGSAQVTELAARLADEARRLLLEERPGTNVTAAVAVSEPAPAPALPSPDGVEIDRSAYRASVDGRPMDLSFREFELLAFLCANAGRVFSRRQLVDTVWDGAAVGDRTVDVHVRRLRVKLGRYADRIVTVRNVGYRYEPARAGLETVA
jgi:DNA-binding response OmpR family regulator